MSKITIEYIEARADEARQRYYHPTESDPIPVSSGKYDGWANSHDLELWHECEKWERILERAKAGEEPLFLILEAL